MAMWRIMVSRIPVLGRVPRVVLALILVCSLAISVAPVWAAEPAISGIVRDASTGLALPGVTVELFDFSSPDPELTPIATAVTDAAGAYSIDPVPTGEYYVLMFSKSGYALDALFDFAYSGTPLVKSISLSPLDPMLTGVVTEAGSSALLEGAVVEVSQYIAAEDGYIYIGSGTSDANGAYTVYDEYESGSGTYEYSAQETAHVNATGSFTWSGSTPATRNIAMQPADEIVGGIVTDADTLDPVADALIDAGRWNAVDEYYEWTGSGFSDATGAYLVHDTMGLGAGDYEFAASADSYRVVLEYQTWNGSDVLVQDFALVPPAVIATGTVTEDGSGTPLEDAVVDASRYDSVGGTYEWAGTAYTDAGGAYTLLDEFGAGAGTYEFGVSRTGYTSQSGSADWNGSDALSLSWSLELAPAIAQGTVTDAASGDPIADAQVDAVFYNQAEDWYEFAGTTTTGPTGAYTVRDDMGYGAGEYTFSAYAYGYADGEDAGTWDGATALAIDFQLSNETVAVPVQGADRFETAVKASQLAFPEDGTCDVAIVASGRNFPDALGGAALAGAVYGPVLLTEPGVLPTSVANEIKRLGASHVIVIGGTSAVSAAVKDAIDVLPGVSTERINGVNRYDTAAQVAKRTVDELGPGYSGQVIVATGKNFPDALAGAPLAAFSGTPILLVEPTAVPAQTADAIDVIAPDQALVLGGTGAVSAAVETQLATMVGGAASVERIDGADRYQTAANIAQWGVDNFGMNWDGVALATGANFPDALAGGAAQGLYGSVVLLTKSTSLEAPARVKLEDNAVGILEVRFFGGLSAISQSVRDAVLAAIDSHKGV